MAARVPAARWVPPENLHVTVAFLGAVEDQDAIERALRPALAAVPAGRAAVGSLGAFPSAARARVIWVGVDDDGTLTRAAAATGAALAPLGFPGEDRPFRAHVTIARLPRPRRIDLSGIDVAPAPVPVDALTVFRSHLGAGPPRYQALAVVPFGAREGTEGLV